MSLLNSFLKIFIPNKSKKDLKEAEPIIKQIHEKETVFEELALMGGPRLSLKDRDRAPFKRQPFVGDDLLRVGGGGLAEARTFRAGADRRVVGCLLYTSPSPRD